MTTNEIKNLTLETTERKENVMLSKLEDPAIFEGFTETVEKTIYISGKMWQTRFEEGRPMKVIGFFRNTYQKWDELSSKMRNHHVLMTPKGDVVINGYGDLDARLSKIPPGACVMVEYVGKGVASKQGFTSPLKFEVRRNPSLDMSPEDTRAMLDDLERQQAKFQESNKPKGVVTSVALSQVKEDVPF